MISAFGRHTSVSPFVFVRRSANILYRPSLSLSTKGRSTTFESAPSSANVKTTSGSTSFLSTAAPCIASRASRMLTRLPLGPLLALWRRETRHSGCMASSSPNSTKKIVPGRYFSTAFISDRTFRPVFSDMTTMSAPDLDSCNWPSIPSLSRRNKAFNIFKSSIGYVKGQIVSSAPRLKSPRSSYFTVTGPGNASPVRRARIFDPSTVNLSVLSRFRSTTEKSSR